MSLSRIRRRLRSWARRHSYSFFSSLGVLLKHRVGTAMTVLVLGIAILLPLGLHVTLDNLTRIDLKREDWGALTVFFQPGAGQADVLRLAETLKAREDVSTVRVVSPEQGMQEFREASGFGQSLDALAENPLPWVLMVTPVLDQDGTGTESALELTGMLQRQPQIELAQEDHKWLERLGNMLDLGTAMVSILMLLFSLTVMVVVANTIRLDVATRAEEIEILALVGAGNGFIRQPFLYSGFWYGLIGGLLALLLLKLFLFYLSFPLGRLLDSYGTQFQLHGLSPAAIAGLLAGCGMLGWIGAWVSVGRHLKQFRVGGSLGRR